jgi:hypothetical protein
MGPGDSGEILPGDSTRSPEDWIHWRNTTRLKPHQTSADLALQPSDVALLVYPANGATKGSMESVRLPSVLQAGFDRGRYPSASKSKSDLEVRIDGGIALPGSLEIGFVDEIIYFRNEHLH